MSLSTGSKLGQYEIIAPLGTGSMGEVYKARDTRLDRTVAGQPLGFTALNGVIDIGNPFVTGDGKA